MSKMSYNRDSGTGYDDYQQFKSAFENEWDSVFSTTDFIVYNRITQGKGSEDGSKPERTERTINSGESILDKVTEDFPDRSNIEIWVSFSEEDVTIKVYSTEKVTSTQIYEKEVIEQLQENNN